MSDTIDYLPPYRAGTALLLSETPAPSAVLAIADRWRWVLWAFVALCYAAAFNGQWRMQPDAALYLAIGRNLATGHGFTYLGQANRLAYPGWPLLISVVFRVFGAGSMIPVHLLMLLISGITLALTYRLFLIYRDRPTAVVVSVGVGLTKAFFCYAFELWSDMPFAMGVIAFLAGYEAVVPVTAGKHRRRWYDWGLLLGGLGVAMSTRPTGWPLLAAAGLGVVADAARRRIRWRTLGWMAAVGLLAGLLVTSTTHRSVEANFGGVYLDYVHAELSGSEAGLLRRNVVQNIRSLFTWAASDVLFQVRFGPVCNSILSVVVLALGFGLFRYRAVWGFWFCFLLGTILISQETLDRYFLPVLPLLVFGWWDAISRLGRIVARPIGDWIFLALLAFGGIVNLTKCCGIAIQQQARPFLLHYDNGQYDGIPKLAAAIADQVPAGAVVVTRAPFGRVTAYLSGRDVVNAVDVRPSDPRQIYVVEPADRQTQEMLQRSHLVEGPPLVTVAPSPNHDVKAVALSLHATHRE
jgi:hypothetical protein